VLACYRRSLLVTCWWRCSMFENWKVRCDVEDSEASATGNRVEKWGGQVTVSRWFFTCFRACFHSPSNLQDTR
jgi:hypothetical protein